MRSLTINNKNVAFLKKYGIIYIVKFNYSLYDVKEWGFPLFIVCLKGGRILKTNELLKAVKDFAMPIAIERGIEVWDVEFKKEGPYYYLRVFLDGDRNVTIEDLEVLTRKLNKFLDEKDPVEKAYILEVASVGIDKPLKFDKDFEKAIGKNVYVKLFSSKDKEKEFSGVLKEYNNGKITIVTDSGEEKEFLKTDISNIHIIGEVSFKN